MNTLKLAGIFVTALLPTALSAQQGIFMTAGRVLGGQSDESSWSVTVQQDLVGPFGVDASIFEIPGVRPGKGELFGFSGDITMLNEGHGFPAIFLGAGLGIGTVDQKSLWGSLSAGLRTPLVTWGTFRMMIEGRYRTLTFSGRDGVQVGMTIGWRSARDRRKAQGEAAGLWLPHSTTETLRARGIPEGKARLLNDVVSVALEEMGQPYVWGGSGDGNGGFDCSGLIYYAYGRQSVSIPRTSAGQARAGIAIRREEALLLPGDILTFAERGDSVTHVGLYVGEGRFIHSSSSGVRLSRMAEDDTEGKGWLRKWVGVRRIVE